MWCVDFYCTCSVADGSSWCFWQFPHSFICMGSIFLLICAIPSCRVLLVTCASMLMVCPMCNSVVFVYGLVLASGSSIHSHKGEQIIRLQSRGWIWFIRGIVGFHIVPMPVSVSESLKGDNRRALSSGYGNGCGRREAPKNMSRYTVQTSESKTRCEWQ